MVKKTLSHAKRDEEKSTRNEKWKDECGLMKAEKEQAEGGIMAV